jgi:hypothetical protein
MEESGTESVPTITDPDTGGPKTYRSWSRTLLLRPIEVKFLCKNLLFVTSKSDQDPDLHWGKMLDPDPHWNLLLLFITSDKGDFYHNDNFLPQTTECTRYKKSIKKTREQNCERHTIGAVPIRIRDTACNYYILKFFIIHRFRNSGATRMTMRKPLLLETAYCGETTNDDWYPVYRSLVYSYIFAIF